MRIALFGGTFDPPHLGHLATALFIKEKLCVDEVRMVVAGEPYLKRDSVRAGKWDRLEMVEALVGESRHEWLKVEKSEVEKEGVSYTIETLERLRGQEKGDRFILVMGSDVLDQLHKWHRVEELGRHADVVVLSREGFDFKEACIPYRAVVCPSRRISSTEIRGKIAAGEDVVELVGEAVASIVKEKKLYTKGS